MLELLYRDSLIGFVKNFAHDDGAWFVGSIELSPAGSTMLSLFEHLVDDTDTVEFNGPIEWMEESNWFLLDVNTGLKKGISLPAIYVDDGSIYWRWR